MGTPLTGSTVSSTYTSLLKTADTTPFSSTLKTICDGAGNSSKLQVSTLGVKSDGTFESQGAATLSSTLAVTGATTLSSLSTSGNASVGGALNVTGATTLAGLTMTGNLSVPGTLSSTGNFAVNTNKFTVNASSGNTDVAGTLGVTGATSLSSLSTSGAATVGTTLGVTGDFAVATNKLTVAAATGNTAVAGTLGAAGDFAVATNKFTVASASGNTVVAGTLTSTGDLTANANTTLGDAGTDTLTINSDNVTLPNVSSATIDFANDTLLIRDNSASNKVRTATMAQITPQCVQTIYQSIQSYTAVNTGPGTEISVLTTSITPRSSSSKLLVTIVLNFAAISPTRGVFRLTRNGTEIGSNSATTSLYGIATPHPAVSSDYTVSNVIIQFYDTSPVAGLNTYKINVFSAGESSLFTTIHLNRCINDVFFGISNYEGARTSSTMTIQEFLA